MSEAARAARSEMRRPRALAVVRDPGPEDLREIDWSRWYLSEEDDVGQSPEQDDVVDGFASALEQHLAGQSTARVGRDAFFAWVKDEPLVRVSPDVYVLDDPPEPPWPKMWQMWTSGHSPPRLAIEVVSDDWKKDHEEAPEKYAALGAGELLIFDPLAARGLAGPARPVLTVYRRQPDGALVRTHVGSGAARLETVKAWAVARPASGIGWLRLARDAAGIDIVPTAAERATHEAQRAERLAARLRALGVDPDEP